MTNIRYSGPPTIDFFAVERSFQRACANPVRHKICAVQAG
jgi:hypothetical protein